MIIALLELGFVYLIWHAGQELAALGSRINDPVLQQSIQGILDQALVWAGMLWGISLVMIIGMVLYLRYLIVRPIRIITGIFQDIGQGVGDLSRSIPTSTHDEIRQLSEQTKNASANITEIIDKLNDDTKRANESIENSVASVEKQNELIENTREKFGNVGETVERLMEDISYDASDLNGQTITIDAEYVSKHLDALVADEDLSRFIL